MLGVLVGVEYVLSGVEPDGVQTFDEIAAPKGALGHLQGSGLMDLLLKG